MDISNLLLKKDQVNVGLFNESFPPVMDGVSVCVENYANWLQQMVGNVSVVRPKVPGTDYSGLPFEVLTYFSFPVPKRPPYVTGIAEVDPMFVSSLLKKRFKIIHSHGPFGAGSVGQRVARFQGIPLIATFHSKFRDDFSRVFPKAIVDVIIKYIIDYFESADLVWVPQESVIDVIREYGYKGHVEVMDNGSDLVADYPEKYFVESRQHLGIGPEDFVLLFVGQHIWEKNTRLIIDSLARVADVPFRMYFVGTGYAEEEMKRMVSEYGLDSKVTFVGTVTDRDKLKEYYAASDLFLFPSLYDTQGLVVREAAALHSPSILAAGSPAGAAITDGVNGFLTANDADSMAGLLRELINDPERVRRVGLQASKTLVRSWRDCVEEALDRYNVLLKSRNLPTIERL